MQGYKFQIINFFQQVIVISAFLNVWGNVWPYLVAVILFLLALETVKLPIQHI